MPLEKQSDAFHLRFKGTIKPEFLAEYESFIYDNITETRKEPGNVSTMLMRD